MKTHTLSKVVAILNRFGYPVTKRTLIDWVQKDLLPHPVKKGLGRGKGTTYQWEQPDIVRQAATIYDLMQRHRRVDRVKFRLWLLGYEMPVEVVRNTLLGPLKAGVEELVKGAKDREDVLDRISGLAVDEARREKTHQPAEIMETWLKVNYLPKYRASRRELTRLITTLSPKRSRSNQHDIHGLLELWESMASFVSGYLTLYHQYKALQNATDAEINQVHSDLRVLLSVLETLRRICPAVVEGREFVLRLLLALGPLLILYDLAIRRAGVGGMVDNLLQRMREVDHQLMTNQEMQREIREKFVEMRYSSKRK